SQLTPWSISFLVLLLNSLALYPTYKWNRFSLISAIWALVGSMISIIRVCAAKQAPMSVARSMPFSLPIAIGSSIIRLTLEDGNKGFKERWKTLFAVVNGKSPEYTVIESSTGNLEETFNQGMVKQSNNLSERSKLRHRIEEITRLIALIIDIISMTVGVFRVWIWSLPVEATNDYICYASIPKGVSATKIADCAFSTMDWKNVYITDECVQPGPIIGTVLIYVYTFIYGAVILGIVVMRGYFIWAFGGVGSGILIVFSGIQSGYSTLDYGVLLIEKLLNPYKAQVITGDSLLALWWHRFGFVQWLIHLFTMSG
ncbi:2260_t:CDS:1, partial [Entrophospora sp. SA101]